MENAIKILNLSLQKPATEDEIKELETATGKNLPGDFKELYLWHNGLNDQENFGSLFYGMDFFPVSRIIEEYRYKKEHYASENIPLKKADKEIDSASMYNTDWIKFAFDGSHTSLLIDLTPASQGTYGQIIFIDDEYETGILVANSTAELIGKFKNDLENNLYQLDEDALEDENHYLTADKTIDIVNWETSEIWNR
ncbi:SMI1/KNR4 family protein [Chryseobacterium vrystaatense]|uniref:SMI1/KNR4 family protein n=1 Tax=Chryseobacterium vrystaatense TaxID=307480 RepID=UPI000A072B31|nr:SMI1/KNR4 family protein [Chryseobacterium vrystaatense]